MYKRLFLLLSLLVCLFSQGGQMACAQSTKEWQKEMPSDSYEKIVGDGFSFDAVLNDTIKPKKKRDLAKMQESDVPISTPSGPLGEGFFYLIAFLIILAIVFYLFKNYRGSFGKVALSGTVDKGLKINNLTDIEDIRTAKLSDLVAEAERQGAFAIAYRFAFLQLLQQLDAQKAIVWAKYKTNADYSKELGGNQAFKASCSRFAKVWYGEMPFSEEEYRLAKKDLERLGTLNGAKNG